ncbi:restriction endonuclease subunit S [Saccharibacillus sacchari]|uniref:Restriction endonuclease subunit S n=1 Tax=Saccharibacillus sacchari TaxID=456493 RepID=A0ACC6PK92_9BACL
MSDKITKSPDIRFAGFTDAWEQRRLNEYLTTSKIKNRDERFRKEDVLSVSGEFGIVNQIEFQGRSFAGVSVATYGVVEKDDVVYTKSPLKSNPFGIIKSNNGQAGIVSTLYAVYKPNDNVDSKFVERYFESHQRLNSYLLPLVNKGAKNDMKVSDDNALSGMVVYPVEVDEQRKISSFFNQLDNLITLHQRELELLKDTKKVLLQKMFPKVETDVPEIRFAGFTEAWEQHEVGEFLEESKIKGSDGSVAKKLTVKLWRKGIVLKEEIYKGSISTQYYIRKSGQFMYGKLDFLNQAFGIVPDELDGYESTLDSPAFDFKNELNPTFFLEYVALERFYKYQGNIANGSRKAKRIHIDTFFRMPIFVPSYEEQQKIGLFFKQLDDIIDLYQCELNSLRILKKLLLQKMFV